MEQGALVENRIIDSTVKSIGDLLSKLIQSSGGLIHSEISSMLQFHLNRYSTQAIRYLSLIRQYGENGISLANETYQTEVAAVLPFGRWS